MRQLIRGKKSLNLWPEVEITTCKDDILQMEYHHRKGDLLSGHHIFDALNIVYLHMISILGHVPTGTWFASGSWFGMDSFRPHPPHTMRMEKQDQYSLCILCYEIVFCVCRATYMNGSCCFTDWSTCQETLMAPLRIANFICRKIRGF